MAEKRQKIQKMLFCVGFGCCLAGCGQPEEQQKIQILDCQTETRLTMPSNSTVKQALEEAEIYIGKDDQISPSLDTVLSAGDKKISVKRCAQVVVSEDKRAREFTLTGGKVKDAIKMAELKLGEYDLINHDLDTYLTDGMKIEVVHRSFVSIDVDGEKTEFLTEADTVGGLLAEQDIHLDAKDQISHGMNELLRDGMELVIHRVFVEEIKEYESIPFDTRVEYSDNLFEGESERSQQGRDGEKEITYEITYVDGEEESRKAVGEQVVREPVSSIIVKGTRPRRSIVSREEVFDCDGSGHGYCIITWSDGAVEYQDF
ncbi:MAG: DUF348 domain-containing protein [Lachnospiraceae bacterium]|nr:DUF348 domain-containing protein [Lachnospiraceae bacterium]